VERAPITVVKADGARESYRREKMLAGLIRACEKRHVERAAMERLIDDVEQSVIFSGLAGEITTQRIGEEIMARLRDLDEVAYVRFASVYRRFTELSQFAEELERLIERREDERKRKS